MYIVQQQQQQQQGSWPQSSWENYQVVSSEK